MRKHNLTFESTEIASGDIALIARCTCGWLEGPHYYKDVLRVYWHDHVHLTDETECALHGTAS